MNSVKDVHLNAKQWDELICDSGIKKDACDKKADPKYPPRINTPPLPEGMKPPAHQVTGHIYGKGKTKLGTTLYIGLLLFFCFFLCYRLTCNLIHTFK